MNTAIKSVKANDNFKPTMTLKQIDAAVKSVCCAFDTVEGGIQAVAVAIMLHAYNHGDYTRAQSLVDGLVGGLGTDARLQALVDWFHKAGLSSEKDKGFTGFNKAVMVKNFDFCKENKWYTMNPENSFFDFFIEAELAKLIAGFTKEQRHELERTRYNLERGITFLKSPRIEVCMQTNFPGKQDYLAHDGKTGVTPINIDIGSDIVGFYHAIKIVNELLTDY